MTMSSIIECTFDMRTLIVNRISNTETSQQFIVSGEFRPNRPKDQIMKALHMSGLLKMWGETEIIMELRHTEYWVRTAKISDDGVPHFAI